MAQKTEIRSKQIALRVNETRLAMLKEYATAHDLNMSQILNRGLDLLLYATGDTEKIEKIRELLKIV